jgi:hypothetical protein
LCSVKAKDHGLYENKGPSEAKGGPIPLKTKGRGWTNSGIIQGQGLYTIGVGIPLLKRLGAKKNLNALALHFSKCPTTYKENIP